VSMEDAAGSRGKKEGSMSRGAGAVYLLTDRRANETAVIVSDHGWKVLALLGTMALATSIPQVIVALFTGVIVDRFSKKRLIQIGQAVAVVPAITIAVLIKTGYLNSAHHDSWWILICASIIQGMASSLLWSARLSIIPELVNSDSRVRAIVKVLDMAGIPRTSMGVTGSMLAGLQNESSDIDFVVYGPLWFRARDAITIAKQQEGLIKKIDEEMWQRIYSKRIPEIPFDEFMLHESRKGNRGMVEGTYFDLLFVKEWDQIKEPLLRGRDTIKMKIEARVKNADFAFDSPAFYKIEHNEIDHVLSYTHTYAGPALPGEIIEACGVVEEVGSIKRLVVGTSREPKGEWIRSLTWLEQCGYI